MLSLLTAVVKNLAHPFDFRVDQVLKFPARHEDVPVMVREVSLLCAPHLGDQVEKFLGVHDFEFFFICSTWRS